MNQFSIRHWVTRVLWISLWLVLTGCLQTRGQLGGAPAVEVQNAKIDNRFYEIDKDFRELYGKIEAVENQVDQMEADKMADKSIPDGGAGEEGASSQELQELKSRVKTLEEALLALDKKISK